MEHEKLVEAATKQPFRIETSGNKNCLGATPADR